MSACPEGWPTRRRHAALRATVLLLAAGVLFGTTLAPQSLEQLIQGADCIVRGTAQAITPGPRGRGGPRTTVVVSVKDQWKGPRLATLRLVLPHGTEGAITQEVAGLPTFRVGEEVILFLVRAGRGRYEVLGGAQGKFSIQTDPGTGKPVVEDLTGSRTALSQFLSRLP